MHTSTEIQHVVVFQYKPTVTIQQKNDIMQRFLALKDASKKDNKPYIVSIVGGESRNSIEGLDRGFDQTFIVTFKNREDFEYYIGKPFYSPFDHAHDQFKNDVQSFLAVNEKGETTGVMVFDFEVTGA